VKRHAKLALGFRTIDLRVKLGLRVEKSNLEKLPLE
jgi:hypothetical protein